MCSALSRSGLLSYAGGKHRLAPLLGQALLRQCPAGGCRDYYEPFAGGASVARWLLENAGSCVRSVHLNDLHRPIVGFWRAVRDRCAELSNHVRRTSLTKRATQEARDMIAGVDDVSMLTPELAFMMLLVNRTSWAGAGLMGGVLDPSCCRWRPQTLCSLIEHIHQLFARRHVEITCLDFVSCLPDPDRDDVMIYLDPPYHAAGSRLYPVSCADHDHARLAAHLRRLRCPWVLTYDDSGFIRELYSWASIEIVDVTYSGTRVGGRNPRKRELLITSWG